jgi:acetyl-CoA carboxylase/biotin carboxylase 1
MYGNDKIDFMEEDYMPIEGHVLAARITAENPDEFKPTSGTIERIKFSRPAMFGDTLSSARMVEFTSSPTVVWSLFAKGANREQARKS